MVRDEMLEFARRTGLSPASSTPTRYLWTDAFAVCNFLELFRQSGDETYRRLAMDLVEQVHHTLGRYRQDGHRTGWISGLDEQEGQNHPTSGGLRIGKAMNERGPLDPFDERLEWDRDGQYYHYLTKWMHALHCLGKVIRNSIYHTWAVELAKTVHVRFTYELPSGGPKRMYWKMSIDLSRPLVESMGRHDPLDGFITYNELQAATTTGANASGHPDLQAEIADMARICEGRSWATDDPLGLGGLLCDAYRVAQLTVNGHFKQTDFLETLLEASLSGLQSFAQQHQLALPPDYRLAFRELGLSIGLHAVERLQACIGEHAGAFDIKRLRPTMETLMRYRPLYEIIEGFWLKPMIRRADSWTGHQDINMVMLATSLAPDGFLRV
ncbi:MAG: hypothetical protein HY788_14240 [Deltaproteobacteria bacterium]|nr:hypothetical protein [Deltaproteobacteria bacterium]